MKHLLWATAAGVHFGSKGPRPSRLTACALIRYHHQLHQQQVPLWRGREKLFGEDSELYKGHYGPSPQLVHAQLKRVLSWSYMSNAHIHQWKIWPTLSAAPLLFFGFPKDFSPPLFALHWPSFKKRKETFLSLASDQTTESHKLHIPDFNTLLYIGNTILPLPDKMCPSVLLESWSPDHELASTGTRAIPFWNKSNQTLSRSFKRSLSAQAS